MTEPVTNERTVPIKGRDVAVRRLTDAQMTHLLRHAKILQKEDISKEVKVESLERVFVILHTVVLRQEDQDYLTEQEELGKVELDDLKAFITAFQDQGTEEEKPKARRGRPPKRLQ